MAETTKMQVFTFDNLALYDELLKGQMSTEDAKSLKTVAMVEGTDKYTIKFYKVTEPVGDTEPAYQVEIPKTDTSGLIPKIASAVAGNVVVSKADGTVADSDIKATDLATKEEVTSLANGAVKTNTDDIAVLKGDATKEGSVAKAVKDSADTINATIGTVAEGKTVVQMISDAQTAATYDDTEVRGLIGDNAEAIEGLQSDKADKATTLAGYGIGDAYTKTETDTQIKNAVASAGHLKREIVEMLPEVSAADVDTIYMIKDESVTGSDKYTEYMVINGAFEVIGDTTVDLSNYATKQETSDAETNAKTYADGLNTAMDTRMDAVEGLVGAGYEPIPEASIRALFAQS